MGTRGYRVVLVGTVHEPGRVGVARERLEELLDHVMEELLRLDAKDAAVDVEFSTAIVRVTVSVEAVNPVEATDAASSFIRSAIHAAGGATPDWPSPDDPTWAVELTGVETGQLING